MASRENGDEGGCGTRGDRELARRPVIVASNRGPVTFELEEEGEMTFRRGGGGLVTALLGACRETPNLCWIACARSEADAEWGAGPVAMGNGGCRLEVQFLAPDSKAYEGYYNVISNPLLWFLQHSMWDAARAPVIDRTTWDAWKHGYVAVNGLFAAAIEQQVLSSPDRSLVMLHDYHLYLAPGMLRSRLPRARRPTVVHFVHIPWPGPEYWRILPPGMRQAILSGLCAVDLLGFQTRDDGLNFLRTCESYLPQAAVNHARGRVWYRNHATHVRDFPISIDVEALYETAASPEVADLHARIERIAAGCQIILRVDRVEPSKNIVRGFLAFEEMLELYPEHRGKVKFLALLVPSRLELGEYSTYLDELMAAAGRINARFGGSEWEPVRVLVGDNYLRAVAALQLYDVLLVNSVADGMNLVAKEGPMVNSRDGVLVLSEGTGARQQLEPGALVVSPYDVYATAEALHQALDMPAAERAERLARLRWAVERDDVSAWLCAQFDAVAALRL